MGQIVVPDTDERVRWTVGDAASVVVARQAFDRLRAEGRTATVGEVEVVEFDPSAARILFSVHPTVRDAMREIVDEFRDVDDS
jgi:hypothetical protein